MMIDTQSMPMPRRTERSARPTFAALLALWLLSGCHPAGPSTKSPDTAATAGTAAAAGTPKPAEGNIEEDQDGVTLTAEQAEKLGIAVEPAKALEHRDEVEGYGVVVSHDAVAQAAADLITAQATARLSRSALMRAQKLQGTPGAVSADVAETAAQKAQVDAAALTATQQKLSSLFGMNPPWSKGDAGGTVQAIADGRFKLLRTTFPLGTLPEAEPTTMRVVRVGTAPPASGWMTAAVWDAPADSAMPGRSFFALLKTQEPREGEHLQVFAPVGDATSGAVVPAAAVVLNAGQYWCYVQTKTGVFRRVQVDTSKPVATGYFVTQGVAAADNIVTNAAGLLLAKETGGAAGGD